MPLQEGEMRNTNRQWLINARPTGRPLRDDDFKWVETEAASPQEGQVLVRVLYLGFDPAQKGWMENAGGYVAPTQIGDVMRGRGIGEVIESRSEQFKPGDKVTGMMGWQDYAVVNDSTLVLVEHEEFLTAYLGVLGSTGLTAYFGLQRVGKPLPGDTVVVTGAAGATGSVVGQLARIGGCRVVGIAGGPEKCAWLVDGLGFDAAIDYKAGAVAKQLARHAPDGIDVAWDNVGGDLLNIMLAQLAMRARVVVCGGISRYQADRLAPGPENYFNLIYKRASMEGFLLGDFAADFPLARRRLEGWLRAGKLRHREDVQHGLENAPAVLGRLFRGANIGKQLLKVA